MFANSLIGPANLREYCTNCATPPRVMKNKLPFLSEKSDKNLYIYIRNNPSLSIDIKGLRWVPLGNGKKHYKASSMTQIQIAH